MNIVAKSFLLPTLRLSPACTVTSVLDALRTKASFFRGSAMVVDTTSLAASPQISKSELLDALRTHGITAIELPASAAVSVERPSFSRDSRNSAQKPAFIHRGHVRSGMQVYAQGRDLIVLGNVHSGAEVIADGSIHVYGKLAGRALAGMHADSAESGRHLVIACSRFSPELLSISNVYSVCETVPEGAEADERVVVQLADNAQELVFACQPWES